MTRRKRRKGVLLRRRQAARLAWFVIASFRGGPHRPYEKLLERMVGRKCAGTGFSFVTGMRDIDWLFGTERAARAAVERLRAVPGVRGAKARKVRT